MTVSGTLGRVRDAGDARWDEAVGRLVRQAAAAESAVALLAARLSGLDDAGAHQLLPVEMENMVRVVRNLLPVRVRDVRLVGDVLAWTHQVRKLYAVRSSVVHTVWAVSDDGRGMVPVWSNAEVSGDPTTVGDLDRTCTRLALLCTGTFDDLLERVRHQLA